MIIQSNNGALFALCASLRPQNAQPMLTECCQKTNGIPIDRQTEICLISGSTIYFICACRLATFYIRCRGKKAHLKTLQRSQIYSDLLAYLGTLFYWKILMFGRFAEKDILWRNRAWKSRSKRTEKKLILPLQFLLHNHW